MANFFGDFDITRILEEDDHATDETGTEPSDQACASQARPGTSTTPSVVQSSMTVLQLTQDILRNVCSTMASDNCLSEDYRQPFEKISESALSDFSFLNGCLLPRGKFPSASAEKSWHRFHQACATHAAPLGDKLGLDMGACFHLCLRLFKELVRMNYSISDSCTEDSSDVSAEEKDILEYIGGFIICSIKRRIMKSSDQQQDKLDVLECLVDTDHEKGADSSNSKAKSLTELYDRGGLVYVKPPVVRLLSLIEVSFRSISPHSICTPSMFRERCSMNTNIIQAFYEVCYDSQSEESVKASILDLMLSLFFKVRIHHMCKRMIDEHRRSKHVSSKQKGIRKSLKSSAPSV